MTKSRKSCQADSLMGSQEPSVRIAPEYSESDGYDAVKIMRVGGVILDPWQCDTLDDWMARSPSGKWACSSCGGSVPRQNGKTGVVQGRASSGMILYNEQVIYTAHLQKTATETFEEMASFFDSKNLKRYVQDIKTALGREQIILRTGARIKFLARTRNGGRGQHGDLLIFDEAQELDDNQQASFLPAISASLNPQTIYLGTPPEPECVGTVFRKIRKRALEGTTRKTAWLEFSVSEIGDVSDKRRWAATNPALGRRMLLSTIEGEFEQMDQDTFARERLGWWPPDNDIDDDKAINQDDWNACESNEPKPDGKTGYGIKFTADGAMVALCGAVCPKDGPARISLIRYESTAKGVQWLADWLNERYKKASCVVVDGKNGVDILIERIAGTWKMKGSVIRTSSNQVIASVGQLTTELSEQTVTWFSGQDILKDSAQTSVKRKIGSGGGWGFGGENSAPIEAAALALWGTRNSKRDPGKKMRIG